MRAGKGEGGSNLRFHGSWQAGVREREAAREMGVVAVEVGGEGVAASVTEVAVKASAVAVGVRFRCCNSLQNRCSEQRSPSGTTST